MTNSTDTMTVLDAHGQKSRALELLRDATRTFHKLSPTQRELLDAGRSIAWAVRRADELGFRNDIQQALDEARFAAETAGRTSKGFSWNSFRDVVRQALYS